VSRLFSLADDSDTASAEGTAETPRNIDGLLAIFFREIVMLLAKPSGRYAYVESGARAGKSFGFSTRISQWVGASGSSPAALTGAPARPEAERMPPIGLFGTFLVRPRGSRLAARNPAAPAGPGGL